MYKISFCISECCTTNDVFSFDAYMHHLGHKCDCRKSWPIIWNWYCTILNIPDIKTLLFPNAFGWDLYHDTTCRSECCNIVVKLRVSCQSFYFSYKTYIPRVLFIRFVCLNTLIRKTRGIYNTYLDNIVDID